MRETMFPKNWWDVFIYVCLRIFSITNLLNAGDYFSHEQTRFLHHQGVSCHVLQSHHSIFFEKENKWIKGHTFSSCRLEFIYLIDTLHRTLVKINIIWANIDFSRCCYVIFGAIYIMFPRKSLDAKSNLQKSEYAWGNIQSFNWKWKFN